MAIGTVYGHVEDIAPRVHDGRMAQEVFAHDFGVVVEEAPDTLRDGQAVLLANFQGTGYLVPYLLIRFTDDFRFTLFARFLDLRYAANNATAQPR